MDGHRSLMESGKIDENAKSLKIDARGFQ